MSDLMFYGVLRMPYEMAMSDELSRRQFWSRAQEAADRVEAAEAELARRAAQPADVGATTSPQAAQGVKRWVERIKEGVSPDDAMQAEIADLRAQLARQSQKPFAYFHDRHGFVLASSWCGAEPPRDSTALYAAPPLSSEQQAEKGADACGS